MMNAINEVPAGSQFTSVKDTLVEHGSSEIEM